MDDDSASHEVELYIYDLTQGMARVMSQMLLGIYYKKCQRPTITWILIFQLYLRSS